MFIRPVLHKTVFETNGMDHVGPLPITKKGNQHYLVMIDCFSKYLIVEPVADTRASTTANAFVEKFVLVHGMPKEVQTDNATTFTAKAFKEMMQVMNVENKYATPHHSEGNAITERVIRTMHDIIAKLKSSSGKEWDEVLQAAAFAHNCSIHETTNETPTFLVHGRDPMFKIDLELCPEMGGLVDEVNPREFRRELT
jgi:hypothetical protein